MKATHLKTISSLLLFVVAFAAQAQYFTKVTNGAIVNLGDTKSSSWGDYDNDGDLDVIAFSNPNNALFRNDCEGNFTQVIGNALTTPTTPFNSIPAEWIDYDNDGDLDIILYRSAGGTPVAQSAQLYNNDGSGNFTLITTGGMVNDTLTPRSASIVDVDNDGFLDVFVSNRDRPNVLYRNNGAGDFIKMQGSALNSFCTPNLSQSSTWGDYDNDGDMDVYVGGGGAYSCFYVNNGNGTFTQINNSPITNVIGSNYGPAWVDYDNDSDLDLFLQIAFAPNLLFMNNNNGTFSPDTIAPFVQGNGLGQGGPTFGDYDNDGDLDLFLANVNGNPNKFYVNNGNGTFTENTSEIITNDILKESFTASFADVDNDGDLDLYVNNVPNDYNDEKNFLYLNNASTTANKWFKIKCIGTQTNKQAIGARVYVKAIINGVLVTQLREINGNSNLNGGSNGVTSNEIHFGLGDATVLQELKIVWPKSGTTQTFANVAPNQFVDVTEGINTLQAHTACANPGVTCANAIALPPHNSSTTQTITGTEQWFSFVADSADVQINVINTNPSQGYVNGITLYDGTCNGLVQLVGNNPIQSTNAVELYSHGLQLGQVYYLKISTTGGVQVEFNLTLDNPSNSPWCVTGTKPVNTLPDILNTSDEKVANELIRTYIKENPGLIAASNYTIPVVVHVVSANPNAIPYQQIQSQITALNAAFAKIYNTPSYLNGQTHTNFAVNTRIQFCLAQNGAGITATEPGVIRHANTGLEMAIYNDATYEGLLSAATTSGTPTSTLSSLNYLNIWVTDNIVNPNLSPGPEGYATLPWENTSTIDGIVIRSDIFGDNTISGNAYNLKALLNQGKILAHEVGHYLGLIHTFERGCTGTTGAGTPDDCELFGDAVCDTPPTNSTEFFCWKPLVNCIGFTPIREDYMSYSDDDCMNTFTAGQRDRMLAAIQLFRNNLVEVSNQVVTGIRGAGGCLPNVLYSGFTTSPVLGCVNQPVNFNNPTGNGYSNPISWTWDFGDLSIPISGSGIIPIGTHGGNTSGTFQSPIHIFSIAGTYTVTLTVVNGTTTTTSTSRVISVSLCTGLTQNLEKGQWFFGRGAGVDFRTGIPVPVDNAAVNPIPHINTSEADVSICDAITGELLFYSDGVSIWNRDHMRVNNISMNGSSSKSQILAVPDPNPIFRNRYYIFHGSDISTSPVKYFSYSILEINGANISPANGDNANINIIAPMPPNIRNFAEQITAIPHCNGHDFWLIFHNGSSLQDGSRFGVFLLSSSGLSSGIDPTNPMPDVYPNITGAPNNGSFFTRGYLGALKASPNGRFIALADFAYGVALYEFNNSTGAITTERVLLQNTSSIYGCSFSSNSSVLYITRLTPVGEIIRFDLANPNSIPAPISYFTNPPMSLASVQLVLS